MSRTRTYKKDSCYNLRCINGGKAADYDNPRCWLDPDNDRKVFCSPECGEYYFENIDEIEQENRATEKYKKRKTRYLKELTEAMFLSSSQKWDKATIRKVIADLGLSSLYL